MSEGGSSRRTPTGAHYCCTGGSTVSIEGGQGGRGGVTKEGLISAPGNIHFFTRGGGGGIVNSERLRIHANANFSMARLILS